MNARELAESDLAYSLEDAEGFGLPVVLIGPGETGASRQDTNALTGELLTGQILYDTVRMDAESGADVITEEPIITLRRASLSRVPKSGEKWVLQIPASPRAGASLIDYILDGTRSVQGGRSVGFIRLYPKKARAK